MEDRENYKNNKIKLISMYDEMSSSYLSYAMSVIVSRALPDIRDGLKPVHRRILFAMYKGGYDWSKQFRKSARIVGDVIGKYHPHGDQAVYDALVRMVQDFSMSLPLIDGQGNFGSIDGDPPAAMRYTETRLSKISQFLIDDIEKNTVDFKSNYDETEREPTVLPAQYPNLLVNGAGGIAVGMATSIPPHNLGEVINGTLALIDNKDIKIKELMKHIPGPDFPTGGIIIGKNIIKEGYKSGRGSFKIRGEIAVENLKNNRDRLVITSIPYQVNKSVLNEKIADLVRLLRSKGHELSRIDLGGGLGIAYKKGEKVIKISNYVELVKNVFFDLKCEFEFEPGRLIVGNAGMLVCSAIYTKSYGSRNFLIVDGAMNDLLRPSLYDAYHDIIPVQESKLSAESLLYDVVGPICETGDTFARNRSISKVKEGDLLAFAEAGAYGATMASEYNTRPLIPEVLVKGKKFDIIRARPSIESIIDKDIVPDWLR